MISLDIDTCKSEWLEDIKYGDSSSASFMASVEECFSERESRKFEEGLNSKVKLDMYKRFVIAVGPLENNKNKNKNKNHRVGRLYK